MADFTLTRVDRYPDGTEVKAYAASNWTNSMVQTDAAPVGSAASTKTMTNGTLTFTGLTAGVRYVAHAEVASEHRYLAFTAGEDISASGDVARQSVIDARYRLLRNTPQRALASVVTGAAVYAAQNGTWNAQAAATIPEVIYIDPAKLAVTGRATKLRLRAGCVVNATAPAITFTIGFYPVGTPSGGVGIFNPNFGTVLAGSTVAFASPAANSKSAESATADFDVPAEGWYCLGMAASGAMAANSVAVHTPVVEYRNV